MPVYHQNNTHFLTELPISNSQPFIKVLILAICTLVIFMTNIYEMCCKEHECVKRKTKKDLDLK